MQASRIFALLHVSCLRQGQFTSHAAETLTPPRVHGKNGGEVPLRANMICSTDSQSREQRNIRRRGGGGRWTSNFTVTHD
ncbi:hypothetical protein BaRGS_00035386 [Batillaria attramentaria]|uniref:Secreted protein n=1 Tax=Batillaria attramentaria TaxID=370345 RepID=A0ABD0JES5_9CAEN